MINDNIGIFLDHRSWHPLPGKEFVLVLTLRQNREPKIIAEFVFAAHVFGINICCLDLVEEGKIFYFIGKFF